MPRAERGGGGIIDIMDIILDLLPLWIMGLFPSMSEESHKKCMFYGQADQHQQQQPTLRSAFCDFFGATSVHMTKHL